MRRATAVRRAAGRPTTRWPSSVSKMTMFALVSLAPLAKPDTPDLTAQVNVNGQMDVLMNDGQVPLLSNDGIPVSELPQLAALNERCSFAVWRAINQSKDMPSQLQVYPDPLDGVSVAPRIHTDDVRIVYFFLASRHSAPTMISRAVRALYHDTHLFLIHVDLKANASVHEALTLYAKPHENVHVLKTRRLVQWAGFSMIYALLDAISSFISRLDFDFLINLSDSELVMRTNDELVSFLRPFKGRAFVRVDPLMTGNDAPSEWNPMMRQQLAAEQKHAFGEAVRRRHPVIECGGFGFVGVNSSANSSDIHSSWSPRCCYGQSGPLLHGKVPYVPPSQPQESHGEYRGAQWAVLPADFCAHLLSDDSAKQWALYFERRLMPDEWYLPTILMHSSWRRTAINHNLRHEHWPAADEETRIAYWHSLPESEWGGAQLLDAGSFSKARQSWAAFAKKVLPSHDPTLLHRYDAWMTRKMNGELDHEQPPLAAPLLRDDPRLHRFGVPVPRGRANRTVSVAPSASPPQADPPAQTSEEDAIMAPRPLLSSSRRRVASLVFSDGSTCSCAADCKPSTSDGSSGVKHATHVDGPFTDSRSSPTAPICCAHTADGRAALCNWPRTLLDSAAQKEYTAPESLEESSWATPDQLDNDKSVKPPCPTVTAKKLASMAGGSGVRVIFLNRTPYPVRLLHLDTTGAEQPVLSIRPAEHAEVESSTSHAWRVRNFAGSIVLELESVPSPTDVHGVTTIHIVDCSASG